jgi:hypothetical protein
MKQAIVLDREKHTVIYGMKFLFNDEESAIKFANELLGKADVGMPKQRTENIYEAEGEGNE